MLDQSSQGSPIADAIEKLRANPEIISMVASALSKSTLGDTEAKSDTPLAEDEPSGEANKANDAVSVSAAPNVGDLVSSLAPLLSSMSPQSGKDKTRSNGKSSEREALLCALKPYVSENRRTAIDYVLRISQISEMFKGLN